MRARPQQRLRLTAVVRPCTPPPPAAVWRARDGSEGRSAARLGCRPALVRLVPAAAGAGTRAVTARWRVRDNASAPRPHPAHAPSLPTRPPQTLTRALLLRRPRYRALSVAVTAEPDWAGLAQGTEDEAAAVQQTVVVAWLRPLQDVLLYGRSAPMQIFLAIAGPNDGRRPCDVPCSA